MDLALLPLQGGPVSPTDPDALVRFFDVQIQAMGTLLGTLVVGALLLALAPDWTERVIATVEDDPVTSFLYGLLVLVALVVVTVALVVTIVGILVVIPLLLLVALLYLVGSATVFVYLGERLVEALDTDTSRWGHLLVGSVLAGVLALVPAVGGVLNFVVNAVGVGAIVLLWRR
jgi:hypothetical protein